YFFFSSRRRHTRSKRDWSSDVCSSDLSRTLLDSVYRRAGTSLLLEVYRANRISGSHAPWQAVAAARGLFACLLPTANERWFALRSEERRVGSAGRAQWLVAEGDKECNV